MTNIISFKGAWSKIGLPNGKIDTSIFTPKDFANGKRFRENDKLPVTESMLKKVFSLQNLVKNPRASISMPTSEYSNKSKIPESAIQKYVEGGNLLKINFRMS